jgi:hypothetical protein
VLSENVTTLVRVETRVVVPVVSMLVEDPQP